MNASSHHVQQTPVALIWLQVLIARAMMDSQVMVWSAQILMSVRFRQHAIQIHSVSTLSDHSIACATAGIMEMVHLALISMNVLALRC
jgi:hypothetical protein